MTSTMVKDVSTIVQSVQSIRGIANQSAKNEAFSEVFQRQTKPGTQGKEAEVKESAVESSNKHVADDVKPESPAKKPVVQEESKEEQIPSEDELNRAMEVLGQAAASLVTEIAQYFQVDEEEILSTLQELQMTPTELFDPQALNRLLMQISDTPDSLTLLTNETLYDSFQSLQARALELLQQSALAVQLEEGQLQKLVTEGAAEAEAIPEVVDVLQNAIQTDKVPDVGQEPEKVTSLAEDGEENPMKLQQESGFNSGDLAPIEGMRNAGTDNANQNAGRREDGQNRAGEAPIVQLLQENRFENVTQQVENQSMVETPDTQDIMRQIMDYMRVTVKPDMSSIEMQLHPESLGTLQVQVANKGGLITAQFVTQSESVRAALESQMVMLRENFEEQGVKIEAIEVTVQAHQFESSYDQGARGGQEEPARRSRTRRIRLDEIASTEDLEGLETEERIAAEMMTANGGTIDYTA